MLVADAETPPARQFNLSRRQMILGGACGVTAGLSTLLVPSKHMDLLGTRKLENVVPKKIGKWDFYTRSGLVVPPEDQLSQQLYSQLLTRVYLAPDMPPIMLLIAQAAGQTGILQVHRPDVCYPAGGFRLSPMTERRIATGDRTITVQDFTATADSRIENLMFWSRVGDRMPLSWWEQRVAVAEANIEGWIPDAVLVRVSTPTGDKAESNAAIEDFVKSFFASLSPDQRQIFYFKP